MSSAFEGSANRKKIDEIYHIKVYTLPEQSSQLEDILNCINKNKWYYTRKDYYSDKTNTIMCHLEWVEEVWEVVSPMEKGK